MQDYIENRISQIDKAIEKLNMLQGIASKEALFNCIFQPVFSEINQEKYGHRLLLVSGFLSQSDKSEESWGKLYELLQPIGINCIDYKWESSTYK